MSFQEISEMWQKSNPGKNSRMSLRTFHQHRKAIEELFGIEIRCDLSDGYNYYVFNPEKIYGDKVRKWLLNSFSLSNLITEWHNMSGRIMLEAVASGIEYLQTIIESMQQGKIIEVDYQSFGESRKTYHMETYAIKVYHQRLYVIGNIQEHDKIRQLALDRILDLQPTEKNYHVPESFNAEKYYANTVGIFVNEELKPQKVRIRVYGEQVDYLRTLPLHRSQEEVLCKYEEYSDFQYTLCLTPELISQLLMMGDNIEVLESQELREEMKKKIENCLTRYK